MKKLALLVCFFGISCVDISLAQVFVTYGNNLGSFNAATGATINSTLVPGLNNPSATTDGANLLVTGYGTVDSTGTLTKYSPSGTQIGGTLVSNLQWPGSVAVSPGYIVVGCLGNNQISLLATYDSNAGFVRNTSVGNGNFPSQMAEENGVFYYRSIFGRGIGSYDPVTNTSNTSFIEVTGGIDNYVNGIAINDNKIYLSIDTVIDPDDYTISSHVDTYDITTGALIQANFISGLSGAGPLAISGNDLLVSNGSAISQYNATSGTLINGSFITGVANASSITVVAVPEPSSMALLMLGVVGGLVARRASCGPFSLSTHELPDGHSSSGF